jgi:hypothetical protein
MNEVVKIGSYEDDADYGRGLMNEVVKIGSYEDKREMALRAGMVASQRLWFTSVNGSSRQTRDTEFYG